MLDAVTTIKADGLQDMLQDGLQMRTKSTDQAGWTVMTA